MSVERLAERITGAITGYSSGMEARTVDMISSRFARKKIETGEFRTEVTVKRRAAKDAAADFGDAARRERIQAVEIALAADELIESAAGQPALCAVSAARRQQTFEPVVPTEKGKGFFGKTLRDVAPLPPIVHVDHEAETVLREMRKIGFEEPEVFPLDGKLVQHLRGQDHVVPRLVPEEIETLRIDPGTLQADDNLGLRSGGHEPAQFCAREGKGLGRKNPLEGSKRSFVGVKPVDGDFSHAESFEYGKEESRRSAAEAAAQVENLKFAVRADFRPENLSKEFGRDVVGFEKTSWIIRAEIAAQVLFGIPNGSFHPVEVRRVDAAAFANERTDKFFEMVRSGLRHRFWGEVEEEKGRKPDRFHYRAPFLSIPPTVARPRRVEQNFDSWKYGPEITKGQFSRIMDGFPNTTRKVAGMATPELFKRLLRNYTIVQETYLTQ